MTGVRRLKVALSANSAWNLANFRDGVIAALVKDGHEVLTLAPADGGTARLARLGARPVDLAMDQAGTSPVADTLLLLRYLRVLAAERPDVLLGYTAKPNVYGSLAAHWLGIPVVNNISGLGSAFIRGGWLAATLRILYRAALRRSRRVFFQNGDDRALFIDNRLVRAEQTGLLPGSGVDLRRFVPTAPEAHDGFVFLVVARLLRDKGILEFVEAARLLRQEFPQARFRLLGAVDARNPTAIARPEVEGWVRDGVIGYLGTTDDVRPHLAAADCVVLPSYREGTPRTLLEAAAMARPLIATDVPGCRDVVDDGINGFLCEVRNAAALASAMRRMMLLPKEARQAMGAASRARVERDYDEQIVIDRYREAVREIAGSPPARQER